MNTEYVFFLLEDFFFEKPVNTAEIERCLDYMERDKSIANFTMMSTAECANPENCVKSSKYDGFLERRQHGMCKLNAAPGLWRKEALMTWTAENDTPWEWEYFGSMRTWFSKAKFYSRKITAPPVFVYDVVHGGAVHRGKWVGKSVRPILEEYGITLDLDKRGVIEDWMESIHPPKPFWLRLPSVIHNRTLYAKNVFLGFTKYRRG